MKKYAKPIALLLAVVMCIGIMTACTSNADNDEDGGTTNNTSLNTDTGSDIDTTNSDDTVTDENEEAPADILGKVSSVSDTSISLTVYESDTEEIDYAALDLTTLTATGSWEEVTVTEETSYWFMEAGTETSAALSDITVDSMIAVTEDENGVQKIIILEKAESRGDEEAETILAEVESIAEDGTLTLMLYALEDAEATTDAVDYTDVEWENYVYAFDTMEYVLPDNATIQYAGDYSLTTTDSAAIEVGTMLVIYQDETGSDMIIVYQNSNIAE